MRERRFIKFASVEFNGQLYMTPQDFLDSIIEPEPRRKLFYCLFLQRFIKSLTHVIVDDKIYKKVKP